MEVMERLQGPGEGSGWRSGLGPNGGLDDELLEAGATGTKERIPVLAFGSNVSPSQLHHKLSRLRARVAIPVVKGEARGLEIAFSAHVSAPGYIPVGLRAAAGAGHRTPVFVTFFDAGDLSVIDGSEGNYDRVALVHPDGGPVVALESGEALWACAAYRTRHGLLGFEAHDANEGGKLLSQCRVRARVQEHVAAIGAPAVEIKAMLRKGSLALRVIPGIAAAGLMVPDGLEPFLARTGASYEQIGRGAEPPALRGPEPEPLGAPYRRASPVAGSNR
ncbi:MAG TPA: hypothetical protein VII47_01445 [Actinomycetota bacterium]